MRSHLQAFKLAKGRIRSIGELGTQEPVGVGAEPGKPWLEKFPDFLIRIQDLIFLFREKSGQFWNVWPHSATCAVKQRRKIMIHLIWYIVVGLIAGIIAK